MPRVQQTNPITNSCGYVVQERYEQMNMRDCFFRRTFVFGLLLTPLFSSGAARADDPVTIRIGHGFSSEEQLWLMKAMPQVATNVGKVYNLAFTAFRSSETRFKAFEAGQLDAGTASAYS